jgi:hypothetical protein
MEAHHVEPAIQRVGHAERRVEAGRAGRGDRGAIKLESRPLVAVSAQQVEYRH